MRKQVSQVTRPVDGSDDDPNEHSDIPKVTFYDGYYFKKLNVTYALLIIKKLQMWQDNAFALQH